MDAIAKNKRTGENMTSENKVCACGKSTRSSYKETCKACDDAASRKSRAEHGAKRRTEKAQARAAACRTGAAKLAKLDAIQDSLRFAGPFLQNAAHIEAVLGAHRAEGRVAYGIEASFGFEKDTFSAVASVSVSFKSPFNAVETVEGFSFTVGEYIVDIRQSSLSRMTVANATACMAAMQAAVTFAAILQAKVAGSIDVDVSESKGEAE